MDRQTDGRMDGWKDGQMDDWTDGWMDGWMDTDLPCAWQAEQVESQ